MTTVINFYGGPGTGKSTMAAQLFGHMKSLNMNVEYASEFAKDLTYQESKSLDDQIYVLGHQHHKIYSLFYKTDYIITDSPLLLTLYYMKDALSKYEDKEKYNGICHSLTLLVLSLYRCHKNINYNIIRNPQKIFLQSGRNQTKEQAIAIDSAINNILSKYNISHKNISSFNDVKDDLVQRNILNN